jgi:Spy/CpxP family protein refolding chaperone
VNPWKVILATMVIFACGVITGSLVTRNWSGPVLVAVAPSPTPTNLTPSLPPFGIQRPEFLRRLDKQLDLTPDQRAKIEDIIKSSHDRTQLLWQQVAPQMNEELKRVREEIRLALTPEQRKRWAELNKRRKPEAAPSQPPSPPPRRDNTDTNSSSL